MWTENRVHTIQERLGGRRDQHVSEDSTQLIVSSAWQTALSLAESNSEV